MRHASGAVPGYMNVLWFGLGISAALMTAFYMFRLYFLTFRGECRDPHAHPHESPWTMGLPLVVLAAGSVAAGYLGLPGGHGNFLRGFLAPVFEGGEASFRSEGSHALEFGLMGVSTLVALAGIALAAWWYVGRGREMPGRLAAAVPSLHRTLVDKWYVDEAYDLLVVRPLRAMSGWAFRLLDVVVVDRGMVHGPARLVTWIGRGLRRGHNGDVQAYLAVLALGLAVLVFVVW
jgi:NADH-quinone oxidoreductase subunit L